MVTVKLYVPDASPVTSVVVPVPVVVIVPGYLVRVHVPEEGNPSSTTLPVDSVHVGGVIVPTDGGDGVGGWVLITTSADGPETHPNELVTVKVNVPAGMFIIVMEVPVPVLVTPPGVLVTVHVPDDGNPVSTTLPVDVAHVGCVMVPVTGGVGVEGWALITTLADEGEVHPASVVTVKVYVPGFSPVTVVLVPVPVVITPSGLLFNVHVPVAGNPFRITLPVGIRQVGWVLVPIDGAAGIALTVSV